MARPARPERSRSALPLRQLSRFCYLINSDMVFGTHSGFAAAILRQAMQLRLPLWILTLSLLIGWRPFKQTTLAWLRLTSPLRRSAAFWFAAASARAFAPYS